MRHEPYLDLRSGEVRDRQTLRGLDQLEWDRPSMPMRGVINGTLVTALLIAAVYGLWLVLP